MEAEIERLYQMVEELSGKVKKLESENLQVNLSLLDLESKFESLRRSIVSGIDL